MELLHQRLGHRSTRSFRDEYTVNVLKDIEFRIYKDSFCTSCQISSMNQKARSENPLITKAPFKWFLWILFQIPSKSCTGETNIVNISKLLMHTQNPENFMV